MTIDERAWAAASLAKARHGADLRRRYRAHGLGVAWVELPDGRRPGIVVYADVPAPVRELVSVEIDGAQVEVPVLVEDAPQASPEV